MRKAQDSVGHFSSSGCLLLFRKVTHTAQGSSSGCSPLYCWHGSVFPEHWVPGKTSLESEGPPVIVPKPQEQTRGEAKDLESGLSLRAECKLTLLHTGFPNHRQGLVLSSWILFSTQLESQVPSILPLDLKLVRGSLRTCKNVSWDSLPAALEA